MTKNKTQPTLATVSTYLNGIGKQPTMWGASMVGYGSYHYKYDGGREGDFFRIGFSSRKQHERALSTVTSCFLNLHPAQPRHQDHSADIIFKRGFVHNQSPHRPVKPYPKARSILAQKTRPPMRTVSLSLSGGFGGEGMKGIPRPCPST
jgi:hypothetical protein